MCYLSHNFLLLHPKRFPFFTQVSSEVPQVSQRFISFACSPINVIKRVHCQDRHEQRNSHIKKWRRSHQIIITIIFKSRNYLQWWIKKHKFFMLVRIKKKKKSQQLIKYRLNLTIVNVCVYEKAIDWNFYHLSQMIT